MEGEQKAAFTKAAEGFGKFGPEPKKENKTQVKLSLVFFNGTTNHHSGRVVRSKGFFGIIIISQILGRCKHHVNSIKVHWGPLGGLRGQASPDEQAERSLYQS